MDSDVVVQSYALVLVTDRKSLKIKAVNNQFDNLLDRSHQELLKSSLYDIFPNSVVEEIAETLSEQFPTVAKMVDPEGWTPGKYQIVAYTVGQEIVLEVEPWRRWPHAGDYAARLDYFTSELQEQPDMHSLLQKLCEGLTFHFGYDRVIVIQFDELHNGSVINESKCDAIPSFLDVRFSEADVPAVTGEKQVTESVLNYANNETSLATLKGNYSEDSRQLLRHRIAAREPSANASRFLNHTGLNTFGYLSLIIEGKLWGSVYLHHRAPLYIDYQMRAFMKVIGRVAQEKVAFHIHHRKLRMRETANAARDEMYDHIVECDNIADGLTGGRITLLDLLEGTTGAAICSNGHLTLFGDTPEESEVNRIMAWFNKAIGNGQIWSTDQLIRHLPWTETIAQKAAGMLYLPLDPTADQWIIWFKPERVHTELYGSRASETNPEKRDFKNYEQICYNCSLPWTEDQLGTAQTLQSFIQKIVMERYAAMARSNARLREAYKDLEIFSYAVGHDLRAPLRGISSFAEFLKEDYGDVIGSEGRKFVRVIQQNADRMRAFMDDLLALNHIDRRKMVVNELKVENLVDHVLQNIDASKRRSLDCMVQSDIPPINGDRNYLIIVFTNLLSNAVKYSSKEEAPRIEVGFTGEFRGGYPVFYISDNGIGIPADQQERIFELFARSAASEEYGSTGIGLALVDRIIRFHHGKIWLESEPGEGSTFYFYSGMELAE